MSSFVLKFVVHQNLLYKMNKYICLFLLLTNFFCYSQIREKKTVELIPYIGYSNSTYSTEIKTNIQNTIGVGFGVHADYYFSDRWSLRSSLMMQTIGGQYFIQSIKVEERLSYLTLPLNANWHFGSTRKWNLNFGMSYGILVAAKLNNQNVKHLYNTSMFGLNYGIGYKFQITEDFNILIEYQGTRGLTYIEKEKFLGIKSTYSNINLGAVFKLQ